MNIYKCLNCNNYIDDNAVYCPICGYQKRSDTIIYHYTSLETAVKILSKEKDDKITLWARRFDLMNDPNDCVYYRNEIKHMRELSGTEMSKEGLPYFVSFSHLADDLHMWNCYGDNGRGVAIGFDKNKLHNLQYISEDKTEHINPKLYLCHYLKGEEIIRFLENYGLTLDKLNDRENWHFGYTIKHPCYKYEMEERLLIASTSMANSKDNNAIKIAEHLEIQIPSDAIYDIILGPCCKQIDKKYKSIIKKSQIPYRSNK